MCEEAKTMAGIVATNGEEEIKYADEQEKKENSVKDIDVLAGKLRQIGLENIKLEEDKKTCEESNTAEPVHKGALTAEQRELRNQEIDKIISMLQYETLSFDARDAAIQKFTFFLKFEMFEELTYVDDKESFWHELEEIQNENRKEHIQQLLREIIKGDQIYVNAEDRVRVKLEKDGIVFGPDVHRAEIPHLIMVIDEMIVIQQNNSDITLQIIEELRKKENVENIVKDVNMLAEELNKEEERKAAEKINTAEHNPTQTAEERDLIKQQKIDQMLSAIHDQTLSFAARDAEIQNFKDFLKHEMFEELTSIDDKDSFWLEKIQNENRKQSIKQLLAEMIKEDQIYKSAEDRVRAKLLKKGIVFDSEIDGAEIPHLNMLIDEMVIIQQNNSQITSKIIDMKLQDLEDIFMDSMSNEEN